MEPSDQVSSTSSSSSLDVLSMIIWLSTGNGKFFELHGSRDIIRRVLPKSSETAFRWGYYNSPADPDRQSYTEVLEAFLKDGFRIEGSSGAGTQGLLRTQYILVKRSAAKLSRLDSFVCIFFLRLLVFCSIGFSFSLMVCSVLREENDLRPSASR